MQLIFRIQTNQIRKRHSPSGIIPDLFFPSPDQPRRAGLQFSRQLLSPIQGESLSGANTHGKNVIRWLLEDLGFEVDPHAHETQCNYADVALLLETVSAAPASKIAGGMIAGPPDCSVLEQFWVPITSTVFPSYSWQAEVIWGGGTPGHQQEEALWYSGVWRPKDRNHFGIHDPTRPVLNIGKYGANWPTLDHLLQRQKKGELVPDKIHTASISLQTEHLLQPLYIEAFADEIKKRKSENIAWLGLAEIADLWKGELYNQEPNIVAYLWFRSYLPLVIAPWP